MRKPQYLFWIGFFAVAASIAVHIYLANHHYQFKYGQDVADGGLCNINDNFNCNATTASAYSEVFGVPIAVFGGTVNLLLLLFLLGYRFPILARSTQEALVTPIKVISAGILLVSLLMGMVSLLIIKTICPMCATAYLLSFISFSSFWIYFGKSLALQAFDFKIIPVVGVLTLVLGFLVHFNQLRKFGGPEVTEIMKLQLEDFNNYPQKTITPVDAMVIHPNPEAKIKIVEFADYLCPHCATVYPMIHKFIKSHPDVEFSFQAFPLDGECNSAINFAEGTRCLLAYVAQCAYAQGKGFEAQDWIFQNQRDLISKDVVQLKMRDMIANLGMNEEELTKCTDSEATKNAIKGQAKVGIDAGIKGTPSLFINGKKIPSGFNIPLLEKIYMEVKKAH